MSFTRAHLSAATAAVANRFVLSTNMKVGDYGAPANSGAMPTEGGRLVTVTHTQVGGVTDTLGTIVVVGTGLLGEAVTDTITPLDGTIATGTKYFRTVTSVTGAGWVINTGNDTIVVGCAAASVVAQAASGVLHAVVINTAAAGAVTIADAAGTIAVIPSNQAAGTFYLYDVGFSGYLSVTAAAATDLTVIHSGSMPTSYAMA